MGGSDYSEKAQNDALLAAIGEAGTAPGVPHPAVIPAAERNLQALFCEHKAHTYAKEIEFLEFALAGSDKDHPETAAIADAWAVELEFSKNMESRWRALAEKLRK